VSEQHVQPFALVLLGKGNASPERATSKSLLGFQFPFEIPALRGVGTNPSSGIRFAGTARQTESYWLRSIEVKTICLEE
jgi:hypothetical protein